MNDDTDLKYGDLCYTHNLDSSKLLRNCFAIVLCKSPLFLDKQKGIIYQVKMITINSEFNYNFANNNNDNVFFLYRDNLMKISPD